MCFKSSKTKPRLSSCFRYPDNNLPAKFSKKMALTIKLLKLEDSPSFSLQRLRQAKMIVK